ncbi:MAG TPA: M67 family metallopeptidase, partial [Anaerolineae bacterium]|nr:M67 family metallopeptidase [Anaerolineae bacterium]
GREAVIFSLALVNQMLAHVLSDPSQERCGLLAGEAGEINRVLPVPNALRSPSAYRMDGPEFIEAMQTCDFDPIGIYHSHISGPATPSATDIAEANYPDSIYFILSLDVSPPSVRGFKIVNRRVSEVDITLN